jgi:murein DD-endopeptidase MepM/ murein hydrolase activator NlpD
VDFGPESVPAGGAPDDPLFDFEDPSFFQEEPGRLGEIEIEKAEFWTGLIQKRIQDRVILAGSTPSILPVRGGLPTHGYRWRTDPFTRKPAFHRGLDIAARRGTPVLAAADGVITYCGWQGGYGKTVEINHNYDLATKYGHLDRFLVKRGARVKKGEVIGEVGSTGRSTGPHLHYEVLEFGRAMNPMIYIEDLRPAVARK